MNNPANPVARQRKRLVTFIRLALVLFVLGIVSSACVAQGTPAHPNWPGPGELFVGACYQPIDRTPEEIDQDIAIMKHAGFNVVRIGDLSWDSFEPSQGKFDFGMWDKVVARMYANGIRVIWIFPERPPRSGYIAHIQAWIS
jgi:beta-galactosidase